MIRSFHALPSALLLSLGACLSGCSTGGPPEAIPPGANVQAGATVDLEKSQASLAPRKLSNGKTQYAAPGPLPPPAQ